MEGIWVRNGYPSGLADADGIAVISRCSKRGIDCVKECITDM